MSIKDGSKAADFKLIGSDGKMHRLKDYKGKTVILYFYPRDNTPGCTKEACGFAERAKHLSAKKAVVLGVSKDTVESHQKFVERFNLPFVLLSDPDLTVMKEYGAWGEKVMYGKKVMGTIRSTVLIGPDGKVMKHWAKVRDAAKHPEDVLQEIENTK